jgi:hypothetical protein
MSLWIVILYFISCLNNFYWNLFSIWLVITFRLLKSHLKLKRIKTQICPAVYCHHLQHYFWIIALINSYMPLYKSRIISVVLRVSSSLILSFRYSFFLFLKCELASRLTLFRLSPYIWLESCNHCSLACFLWSHSFEHSSSSSGSCSFRPYWTLIGWNACTLSNTRTFSSLVEIHITF